MKTVVIEANDESTTKLLLELAKKMGLKAHLEKKRGPKPSLMPSDDRVLEKMMDEAEENFKKGNYLSAKEAREKVEKWTLLPKGDSELKKMIKKAEADFAKGKGLSTNEVRKIISSCK